ncbi:MAG TPA: PEP-CTERM sorting domain-containing protein [Stellaceae bacterium]|nr:PEP-CTERM sorting domain-containing protein [Stellaceae bacterium]
MFERSMRTTLTAALLVGAVESAGATPFTGPTGAYYLDNFDVDVSGAPGALYVVQGSTVINSFAVVYGQNFSSGCIDQVWCEGNLAVTNVISTTGFGNGGGGTGSAGQYTLGGTPTGVNWIDTPPPSGQSEVSFYDGTADGTHNYTVEYDLGSGNDYVVETNLNWQNPVPIFSLGKSNGGWLGIAFDPANDSLWLSGSGFSDTIADYSLSGVLLSSFTTDVLAMSALAYDPTDGTLWFNQALSSTLYQYSTDGQRLQSGTPVGLPEGFYSAGEFSEEMPIPEPSSLAIFAAGVLGLGIRRSVANDGLRWLTGRIGREQPSLNRGVRL